MKILRPRDYFFPEIVASSHLSDDMDEAYARHKIICVNHTPMPTRGISDEVRKQYKKKKYEEKNDGFVVVKRFSMIKERTNTIQRAVRYLLCSLVQYFKGCMEKDIDVIYGGSTPPTQGMLCALIKKHLQKKRGVAFVYNLQDVFPDSLVNAGMARKGSIIWRIGRKIEDYTYTHADRIVVISDDIRRNIISKGVDESKIRLIPNWVDTEKVQPIIKENNSLYEEFGIKKNKFTVIYAGNMGAAQGACILIDVAKKLNNIQFVVFGGGAEFSSFKDEVQKCRLSNMIVNPLLPSERVSEVYSIGDLALITCKPGTGVAGMPSKTWTIMACNTPIIASFDTESELARILKKSKTGICVSPGDVDEIVKAIELMSSKQSALDTLKNGREYVEKYASKHTCTEKTIEVLQEAFELCNAFENDLEIES